MVAVETLVLSSAAVGTDTRPRRITVTEYHQMIEAGILREGEHVELLGGVLLEMTPQGPSHGYLIQRLNEILLRKLTGRYAVRPQLPLTLGDDSEPEPDFAIVQMDAASPSSHPTSALLVIEVAHTSLKTDRNLKATLYARAAIPELWVVNLDGRCLEIYTDPEAGRYQTSRTLHESDIATARAVPDLSIPVSDLFS